MRELQVGLWYRHTPHSDWTQYLAAGLLDEMVISIVPPILGDGARLFAGLGDVRPMLKQLRVVEAPGVTHIRSSAAR